MKDNSCHVKKDVEIFAINNDNLNAKKETYNSKIKAIKDSIRLKVKIMKEQLYNYTNLKIEDHIEKTIIGVTRSKNIYRSINKSIGWKINAQHVDGICVKPLFGNSIELQGLGMYNIKEWGL